MPPASDCEIVKRIASKEVVWIEDYAFSESLFCIDKITFEKVCCLKMKKKTMGIEVKRAKETSSLIRRNQRETECEFRFTPRLKMNIF